MDEGLAKIRHARSTKDFPYLKLQEDEYVEFSFKRSKICLMAIFGGVTIGLALVLVAFLWTLLNQSALDEMGRKFIYIILVSLVLAAILVGLIAVMIYRGNRLFITNKRVIQLIMQSPVSTSVNAIDLPSIEDVSFHQNGIIQKLFRYGTFRLSTVGDETTYTFNYSDVSPSEIKAVSKLITEAKTKRVGKKAENKKEEDEKA